MSWSTFSEWLSHRNSRQSLSVPFCFRACILLLKWFILHLVLDLELMPEVVSTTVHHSELVPVIKICSQWFDIIVVHVKSSLVFHRTSLTNHNTKRNREVGWLVLLTVNTKLVKSITLHITSNLQLHTGGLGLHIGNDDRVDGSRRRRVLLPDNLTGFHLNFLDP